MINLPIVHLLMVLHGPALQIWPAKTLKWNCVMLQNQPRSPANFHTASHLHEQRHSSHSDLHECTAPSVVFWRRWLVGTHRRWRGQGTCLELLSSVSTWYTHTTVTWVMAKVATLITLHVFVWSFQLRAIFGNSSTFLLLLLFAF